jgi:hypothetical protein
MDYNGVADHNNNVMMGLNVPCGFTLPVTTGNRSSWKFMNLRIASGGSGHPAVFGDGVTLPYGVMIFADLPGQSGTQSGPFEAQEFDITDGAKFGGGAAVWGDQVQGAGSGHYKVRYDGTIWRRIG